VTNTQLLSTVSNFTVLDLEAYSVYNVTLNTFAFSNQKSSGMEFQTTTQSAPLTSVTVTTLTSNSVTVSFLPSTGASSFSCLVVFQRFDPQPNLHCSSCYLTLSFRCW